MKATTAILMGLGVIVAIFWWLGAGVQGTGDQSDGSISGPTGDARSSPSAGTTGSSKTSPVVAGAVAAGSDRHNNLPPLVLVSPANIVPENVITASGQGFQPGEQVELVVNGSEAGKPLATASALVDKDGNFYGIPITITMGSAVGEHSVVGQGRKSGREAQTMVNIEPASPYANPSTYSGKGGTTVSFEAGGFRPEELVSLHFDSLAVDPLSQAISGSDGTVGLSGTVPLTDAGDHAFFLVGEQGHIPVRVSFSVVGFSPWISPTNYSPRPQQLFGFVGHDFAPGETVRFYRGKVGESPIATGRADQEGNLTLENAYELPVDAVGKNQFLATGVHSRNVVSVTVDVLPFSPSLELSEYAGRGGTSVSLKGAGYGRNEPITVYIGGIKSGREVSKLRAGEDGSFEQSGTFTIPPDTAPGNLTIAAIGEYSRTPLEISFAVLPFTSWLALSSYVGPPGTSVTFDGHDFLPNETVTIHLGDQQSPALGTVRADAGGGFSGGGKYTIPEGADGTITFTAYGESSHATAAATFMLGVIGPDEPTEDGEDGETPPAAGATQG